MYGMKSSPLALASETVLLTAPYLGNPLTTFRVYLWPSEEIYSSLELALPTTENTTTWTVVYREEGW